MDAIDLYIAAERDYLREKENGSMSNADRLQLSMLHSFLKESFAGSSIGVLSVDDMIAALARTLDDTARPEGVTIDAVLEKVAQMCEGDIEHIIGNARNLKRWPEQADEARARELGALYVKEFAWLLRTYKSDATFARTLISPLAHKEKS